MTSLWNPVSTRNKQKSSAQLYCLRRSIIPSRRLKGFFVEGLSPSNQTSCNEEERPQDSSSTSWEILNKPSDDNSSSIKLILKRKAKSETQLPAKDLTGRDHSPEIKNIKQTSHQNIYKSKRKSRRPQRVKQVEHELNATTTENKAFLSIEESDEKSSFYGSEQNPDVCTSEESILEKPADLLPQNFIQSSAEAEVKETQELQLFQEFTELKNIEGLQDRYVENVIIPPVQPPEEINFSGPQCSSQVENSDQSLRIHGLSVNEYRKVYNSVVKPILETTSRRKRASNNWSITVGRQIKQKLWEALQCPTLQEVIHPDGRTEVKESFQSCQGKGDAPKYEVDISGEPKPKRKRLALEKELN
nr:PREDICTED: uncharacterized protein C22orf31 homolog [Latimeria chalumnae]|eukprot:XP_014340649.1 PREDICTED: uncharacterized protein C22orf31 homolog [Latimeria chalumnae]